MGYALAGMLASSIPMPSLARPVWTASQANQWYTAQPWLVGANYIPSTAINQLEMWQQPTFDPATIDRELGWAHAMGMNSMRVFLHDLLWAQDSAGFTRRIDAFLSIAQRHHIRPIFVLFDSCWDPDPQLGPQHPPIPGVHNSGWVQSPGRQGLQDASQRVRLEAYVKGVVGRFRQDRRVLAWDIWNEPDSPGGAAYRPIPDKAALVENLIVQAFGWARSVDPVQPLTTSLFQVGDWDNRPITSMEKAQLEQSDILSFHEYRWPDDFERSSRRLLSYGRPVLATEYLARGAGSTIEGILPVGKRYNIGMYNWGFVDGKTQTRLPWDSWTRPYVTQEPVVWFHDLLHSDGKPYRQAEVDLIQRLATTPKGVVPVAPALEPLPRNPIP
ncbi:1,4-beta-xylanase [Nostoc sp. 3335mG]|nr:1,4-beta-xylanase [Nostoc sp. 3335mG]